MTDMAKVSHGKSQPEQELPESFGSYLPTSNQRNN